MTKFVWGIILLIALLCIIFLPSLSQPKQFHFGYVEQGYECYESSFNPHRVFEEWQLIHGELFSTTFIYLALRKNNILNNARLEDIEKKFTSNKIKNYSLSRTNSIWI